MNSFGLPIVKNLLKTRNDLQVAINQICNPLEKYYSEGCAQLHLGNSGCCYSEKVAEMEGFSRPLWGLVPLFAGGGDSNLLSIYIEGLKNGTDPNHPEYWGEIEDYDQRMVEMASIGLALAMIPDKIWEPLNDIEKENLFNWLNQINEKAMPDNNWRYFRIFVNVGFEKIGFKNDKNNFENDFDLLENFYLSDGWYSDGKTQQRDYYISFAMHFYGLIYSKLMKNEDPVRGNKFIERAKLFAKDFIYWFAPDGSAIPFGRSLTYKFAQISFWSALAFAEVEVYSYGVIKGIIMRNLRWWFKKPIFTSDGVLTVGYGYPNLNMAEGYNSPGSPYWSLKAFIILAMGENHEFWKAEEEPLPTLKQKSFQKHSYMIVNRDDVNNHVFALTSGQYANWDPAHAPEKYSKFAYSNIFGFNVKKDCYFIHGTGLDSMLALSECDGVYRVRRECERIVLNEDCIYSMWKPWNDVIIETWLIPVETWHVRVHKINTPRKLYTVEGGFAIPSERDKETINNDMKISNDNMAAISCNWGTSAIMDLKVDIDRNSEVITNDPNMNVIHPRTIVPALKTELEPGVHWLASSVIGSTLSYKSSELAEIKKQTALNIRDNSIIVKYKNIEKKFNLGEYDERN